MLRTFIFGLCAASLSLAGCSGDSDEGSGSSGDGGIPDGGDGNTGADDGNDGDDGDSGGDGGDGTDGGGDGSGDDGGGTESDDGDDGGAFVGEPDSGDGMTTCDPWAQDCPEGEKCAPYRSPSGTTWDANRCVPVVANPKSVGDTCTELGGAQSGEDDCDFGAVCNWLVEGVGICAAMCTGTADNPVCEDPDTSCNIDNDGSRILCNPICDPLLQDCPDPTRMTCLVAIGTDSFNCELGWGDGGLLPGEDCYFDNSCLNGNLCVYEPDKVPGCVAGPGCCAPYCDVNEGAGACPAGDGTSCVPFFEQGAAWPGYEHVGICLLP